jgi:hypothetical protein
MNIVLKDKLCKQKIPLKKTVRTLTSFFNNKIKFDVNQEVLFNDSKENLNLRFNQTILKLSSL